MNIFERTKIKEMINTEQGEKTIWRIRFAKGGCTWYNKVDSCCRIPVETHWVAQEHLRFWWMEIKAVYGLPFLLNQSIDVV